MGSGVPKSFIGRLFFIKSSNSLSGELFTNFYHDPHSSITEPVAIEYTVTPL